MDILVVNGRLEWANKERPQTYADAKPLVLKKWHLVRDNLSVVRNIGSVCAFCYVTTEHTDGCDGCPIDTATGDGCSSSPYSAVQDEMFADMVDYNALAEAVDRQIKFLEELKVEDG